MTLQRSYLLLRLYTPELNCSVIAVRRRMVGVSSAASQILAVWRECDGEDSISMGLQGSYLLVRIYAPELNYSVMAAGSQILAVWRECE